MKVDRDDGHSSSAPNHRTVFWLGPPTLGDQSLDDGAKAIGEVMREEAAKRAPDVMYVDTYKLFSTTDGELLAAHRSTTNGKEIADAHLRRRALHRGRRRSTSPTRCSRCSTSAGSITKQAEPSRPDRLDDRAGQRRVRAGLLVATPTSRYRSEHEPLDARRQRHRRRRRPPYRDATTAPTDDDRHTTVAVDRPPTTDADSTTHDSRPPRTTTPTTSDVADSGVADAASPASGRYRARMSTERDCAPRPRPSSCAAAVVDTAVAHLAERRAWPTASCRSPSSTSTRCSRTTSRTRPPRSRAAG